MRHSYFNKPRIFLKRIIIKTGLVDLLGKYFCGCLAQRFSILNYFFLMKNNLNRALVSNQSSTYEKIIEQNNSTFNHMK